MHIGTNIINMKTILSVFMLSLNGPKERRKLFEIHPLKGLKGAVGLQPNPTWAKPTDTAKIGMSLDSQVC